MFVTFFRSLYFLFCLILSAYAQRNASFPFVTIEDSTIAFDNLTTKSYTTTITVEHGENETLSTQSLSQALTNVYGGPSLPGGFEMIDSINVELVNFSKSVVSYRINYNYASLIRSTPRDSGIVNTIADKAFVQRELSKQNFFAANRSVVNENFSIKGESLCEKVGCKQGAYVICSETRAGVESLCSSTCKRSYCVNEGWCHHHDGNQAPTCSCKSTVDSWYVGQRCELLFQMWMLIVFIVVVALVLILIVILSCCFIKRLNDKSLDEIAAEKWRRKRASRAKATVKKTLSILSFTKFKSHLTVERASSSSSSASQQRYVNAPREDETRRSVSLPMDRETSRVSSTSFLPATVDGDEQSQSRDHHGGGDESSSYYNTTNYDTIDTLHRSPPGGAAPDVSSVSSASTVGDSDGEGVDSDTLRRQFREIAASRSNRDLNRGLTDDVASRNPPERLQTIDI